MADAAVHEMIIVRRHDEEEHDHHSSAWKVAHADFMTAMMAFFLIMWLTSVTDDQMRKGIAEYFNPIHMSQGSSELKGLAKSNSKEPPTRAGHGEMPVPEASVNLIDLAPGHANPNAKALSPEAAAAALSAAAEVAAKLAAAGGVSEKDKGKSGESLVDALKTIGEAAAALKPANGGNDRDAFQDPYAVLAKLEQDYVSTQPTSVDAITGDARAMGTPGGEIERDPFDPSYWQIAPLPAAKASETGKPGMAQQTPDSGKPDAASLAPSPAAAASEKGPVKDAAAEPPADTGQAQAAAAATVARSTEIAKDIKTSVAPMMADKASPGLAVTATAEGVTINLTDDADYAMFAVGSAVPDAKIVVMLERIAKVLAAQPGQIIVRGHTDGRPFHSADYDNWRLSAARAQMAYYALLRGGLDQSRVIAIEGHADRALKTKADPYAAENRRIEILVKGSQ